MGLERHSQVHLEMLAKNVARSARCKGAAEREFYEKGEIKYEGVHCEQNAQSNASNGESRPKSASRAWKLGKAAQVRRWRVGVFGRRVRRVKQYRPRLRSTPHPAPGTTPSGPGDEGRCGREALVYVDAQDQRPPGRYNGRDVRCDLSLCPERRHGDQRRQRNDELANYRTRGRFDCSFEH